LFEERGLAIYMKKKVVLITGASRGLGKALAQEFAKIGNYKLILHSKESDLPELKSFTTWTAGGGTRTDMDTRPVPYEEVKGGLESIDTIRRLQEKAREMGGIDILINNAGVHKAGSIEDVDPAYYLETTWINMIAPMLLTRYLWESVKKKKGLILFINSIAGKVGAKDEFLYCTTKHGLKGFADSIQFDATQAGINVVSAYLGAMKTDMTKHRKDYEQLMEPEEAANFLFRVCKDYASMRVTEVDICRRRYGV
jgi:NAD(P)-dependent dehydrogenase (short-subunit alcohol dehydrogenase family)